MLAGTAPRPCPLASRAGARQCLNALVNDYDVPRGIDVLRVFCGPDGRYGNALGVVRDGSGHPDEASRQRLTRQLGFSETVFVDDPERGRVDIHTPGLRLPFAGHPLVGAAWLLDLEILELAVGDVFARQDGEFTWITARPEWAPPRTLQQYASAAEVEALPGPPPGEGWLYAWAWEDEATGAAAMLLSAHLGRALNITQGRGSQILTAPAPDGTVEVGGRVLMAARG